MGKGNARPIEEIQAEKVQKTLYTLLPCFALSSKSYFDDLSPETVIGSIFEMVGAKSLSDRSRLFQRAVVETLALAESFTFGTPAENTAIGNRADILGFPQALEGAATVMAYGATKHGRGLTGLGTYRDPGSPQGRITEHLASWVRHLFELAPHQAAFEMWSEVLDEESKLPVVYHACCQALIAYDLFLVPNTVDTVFDEFLLNGVVDR